MAGVCRDAVWARTRAWLDGERRRDALRVCAACRRWVPPASKGAPGRCLDGYSAWPSDTCAKFKHRLNVL